jgi:hypothetical protein
MMKSQRKTKQTLVRGFLGHVRASRFIRVIPEDMKIRIFAKVMFNIAQVTTWSEARFQELVVIQLVEMFRKPECLLPCSREPTTGSSSKRIDYVNLSFRRSQQFYTSSK